MKFLMTISLFLFFAMKTLAIEDGSGVASNCEDDVVENPANPGTVRVNRCSTPQPTGTTSCPTGPCPPVCITDDRRCTDCNTCRGQGGFQRITRCRPSCRPATCRTENRRCGCGGGPGCVGGFITVTRCFW